MTTSTARPPVPVILLIAVCAALLACPAPRALAAPQALTLTADSAEKVYDGDPLTAPSWTITQGALLEGHALEALVSGSVTVCGEAPNVVLSWTIRNAAGADVSARYDVTREAGVLAVTPARFPLTLTAAGAEKPYDGLPLANANFIYDLDRLRPGHTIRATVEGEIILPGYTHNIVTAWVIRDRYGRDVTENYRVTTRKGILRVHRAAHGLTITADSAEKPFDGLPLTAPGFTADLNALMPGDCLVADVQGSQTEPGQSANRVVAFQILRPDGTDVTANYAVIVEDGVLIVTEDAPAAGAPAS